LAARIDTLRDALTLLWSQSDYDRGEPFRCIGRMKVHLIELETELRERDREELGIPYPLAVALALAVQGATGPTPLAGDPLQIPPKQREG